MDKECTSYDGWLGPSLCCWEQCMFHQDSSYFRCLLLDVYSIHLAQWTLICAIQFQTLNHETFLMQIIVKLKATFLTNCLCDSYLLYGHFNAIFDSYTIMLYYYHYKQGKVTADHMISLD